ncbi:unnamed protein product [Phytophthora fragariaefolia]|uniref:Unnamed protein product n=1 Tax=Phytophthora fragariaefolia TaxID=1490495 RepID=A0A9W6U5N4_9STRA|nr:unnamed protein product [Phytophthora fragariaefolia]
MTMTTFTVVWAFNSSNDISKAARRGDEYDQEFSRVSDVSVQLNLAVINSLLCLIFFTRGIRDLATSQSWFLSIWNNLDMNGRVTTVAYFVFFCFWEFLPTVLLLCLISSKAGGVGGEKEGCDCFKRVKLAENELNEVSLRAAPKHGPASQKLPDYGIFHIINTGEGKVLAASPLGASTYSSYGTRTEGGFDLEPERERPRWTHGGDLFQDPLRYDSDDGPAPSPRHFSDSYNSDASNSNYYYERVPGYSSGI